MYNQSSLNNCFCNESCMKKADYRGSTVMQKAGMQKCFGSKQGLGELSIFISKDNKAVTHILSSMSALCFNCASECKA